MGRTYYYELKVRVGGKYDGPFVFDVWVGNQGGPQ